MSAQREAVTKAVGDLVGVMQREFAGLGTEFTQRGVELRDAAISNANAVMDGSITVEQAQENVELLVTAMQSELLVAGYKAKAKVVGVVGDALEIALRLAVGLLAA